MDYFVSDSGLTLAIDTEYTEVLQKDYFLKVNGPMRKVDNGLCTADQFTYEDLGEFVSNYLSKYRDQFPSDIIINKQFMQKYFKNFKVIPYLVEENHYSFKLKTNAFNRDLFEDTYLKEHN